MQSPPINGPAVKSDKEIEHMSNRTLKNYAKEMSASYQSLVDHLFHPENGVLAKLQEQLAFSQRKIPVCVRLVLGKY